MIELPISYVILLVIWNEHKNLFVLFQKKKKKIAAIQKNIDVGECSLVLT